MPQYLVAIQHPENYDPSLEGDAMIRDIGALNEEMDAAGARFFAGGLESASHAKSLRKQPGGNVSITDGPYLEAKVPRGRLCSGHRSIVSPGTTLLFLNGPIRHPIGPCPHSAMVHQIDPFISVGTTR